MILSCCSYSSLTGSFEHCEKNFGNDLKSLTLHSSDDFQISNMNYFDFKIIQIW